MLCPRVCYRLGTKIPFYLPSVAVLTGKGLRVPPFADYMRFWLGYPLMARRVAKWRGLMSNRVKRKTKAGICHTVCRNEAAADQLRAKLTESTINGVKCKTKSAICHTKDSHGERAYSGGR